MGKPTTSVEGFWDRPLHELFELLPATPAGLTTEEARRRLRLYEPNSFVHESRFAALLSFFGFFRNPLVVILVIASGVSLALGEHVGGLIILAIVLFSVILNFLMEFQARHAVEDIQKQIALTARGSARWTRTGIADRRVGPGRYCPAQRRRPGSGRCPFAGGKGPACARVRAYWGIFAGREDGG